VVSAEHTRDGASMRLAAADVVVSAQRCADYRDLHLFSFVHPRAMP
jgi:hypothetical protein